MRRLLAAPLLVGLGAVAQAQPAPPELCADGVVDPVPVTLRAGGFDATRSACLRSDLDIRVAGHALIDTPSFYGTLGGELAIGIRFVESFGVEWGAALRLAEVTFAQTAVISATEATYGPLTLHAATSRRLDGGRLQLGGVVLAEVPFSRSNNDISTSGAQVAGLATWRVHPRVALHHRAGLLGWYGASAGGTSRRGAAVASTDAAIRLVPWLHGFAGVEVGAGWYRSGLDHVAARVGAHWRVFGPWRLDVGALLPLVGQERTDLAVTLGVRRDR